MVYEMIVLTILILALLEVSLSFDNAVVNATVLRDMPPVWQKRFLTWGILIAVLGMRLVFPVLIVSLSSGLGIVEVTTLAITDPGEYGVQLTKSHAVIAAFGGMFLLMVFWGFLTDQKEAHWWGWLERKLAGADASLAVAVICSVTLLLQYALPWPDKSSVLVAGTLGIASNLLLGLLLGLCGEGNDPSACVAKRQGLMRFIYLEVLDASFSFDGVIGAFAVTNNFVVIMIGLGIGAAVIRFLTLKLVREGTLKQFIYLEHGTHYGIGSLALLMLASTVWPIPELITGLTGAAFIGLSLLSSVAHNRKKGISRV